MNSTNPLFVLRSQPLRLSLVFAVLTVVVYAQPATGVELPAPAHGAAAITALGAHLPDVARAYGLAPQELATRLRMQPSLGVDKHGALLFRCVGSAVSSAEKEAVTSSEEGLSDIVATAETDEFALHSLPGAPRVVYLDFTGHSTSGTNWNSSYGGGNPIISAPFSIDADANALSDQELTFIRNVWRRVAEDFAPFSVDVTTQDPGVEGLRRTDANDLYYGIRVVISPTNWYSTSAGGVGYINSFKLSTDTPVFVFTAQLGTGEKAVAECCSHETGHSLGLYHDGLTGTNPTEYYGGQGNWAPIMGNSYSRAVTQWSRGEYPNASNTADDTAIIATFIGVSDDHGNSLANATTLAGPAVSDGGTIETRLDVDVFKFDTGAGTISFAVSGATLSPNLDIKTELLNSADQVLQVSDSLSSMNASLTATVPGGTYFLRVDGVGNGDAAITGYSDYASLGNYTITGTIISTGTQQAPTAVITASGTAGTVPFTVNFSAQNSSDADGIISSHQWSFGTGDSAAGINASYTYTTAGTYTATLTVIDNEGLAGTSTVTITVAAAPNVPPTAVASANVTSGIAPLPVNFSSIGSTDTDGQIVAYKWEFGDGTSATTSSAAKIYAVPGNYVARLTVTDNRGGTSSATINISVASDPNFDSDVQGFSLSTASAKSGSTATAVIVVLDRLSRPVVGATVSVQWSGVVSGTSSGKTDSAGKLSLVSPRSKKAGAETATISTVVPPTGGRYDPSIFSTPLVLTTAFK